MVKRNRTERPNVVIEIRQKAYPSEKACHPQWFGMEKGMNNEYIEIIVRNWTRRKSTLKLKRGNAKRWSMHAHANQFSRPFPPFLFFFSMARRDQGVLLFLRRSIIWPSSSSLRGRKSVKPHRDMNESHHSFRHFAQSACCFLFAPHVSLSQLQKSSSFFLRSKYCPSTT